MTAQRAAAVATAILGIGSSNLYADEALYNKTFTPVYRVPFQTTQGQDIPHQFYISDRGEVHWLMKTDRKCDSDSYSAPLDGSKDNNITCNRPDGSKYRIFAKTKARLTGNTIFYEQTSVVTSSISTNTVVYSVSFEATGDTCTAKSYTGNGQLFPPVSCTVSPGKAALLSPFEIISLPKNEKSKPAKPNK